MGKFYDVASKEQVIYSGSSASPFQAISIADTKLYLSVRGKLFTEATGPNTSLRAESTG
jgi:hypothetical protein